jgi:cell wall-associated NlpC family hydrolase
MNNFGFQLDTAIEYQCFANLNIYDSPNCDRLATQASTGRHLTVQSLETDRAIPIRLCEDDYPGWLNPADIQHLTPAPYPYRAPTLSATAIQAKIPDIIAFTHQAMAHHDCYLWGGTVGPNYDCSGLMQAAFASVGVRLPRDAYQQEAFTQPVAIEDLQPGDLIFFGSPEKATHVGLYLGDGCYIHSSGREFGRDGIGIDRLSDDAGTVSRNYFRQLRGAGRVASSFCPGERESPL